MMIDRDLLIVPFRDTHLEDAAALVRDRYVQLHRQEPLLPSRYTRASAFLPLLRGLCTTGDCGVAAMRGGRLVGFLAGWRMPSFRGQRSTYSPEWANAAVPGESKAIYEELYRHLSADWVSKGFVAHYVSLFPNDEQAIRALHWLGFGMVGVDAIRGVETIAVYEGECEIRQAEVDDLEGVVALDEALWRHMKGAPAFYLAEKRGRAHFGEWIRDPRKDLWLAIADHEPVAFLSLGPANEDVCTIIVDEGTTSIYGAFTKASRRGKGVGAALLARALAQAREAGYVRCAVDFEPMNLEASRFWLKHFRPVCLSLLRIVDERVLAL